MTPEQEARNLLERLEMPGAQELSSGDVLELANLIAENRRLKGEGAEGRPDARSAQIRQRLADKLPSVSREWCPWCEGKHGDHAEWCDGKLLADALAELDRLTRERDEAKLALGEAAREINCAGPVAHRIRVLKDEHRAALDRGASCAHALRELVEEWRARASVSSFRVQISTIEKCANELEAALAADPAAPPVKE